MKMRNAAIILGVAAPLVVAGVVGLAFAGTHVDAEDVAAASDSPRIVDSRDQYELVQEIMAARSLPEPEMMTAFDATRASWHGRRYHWEVALVPTLCRTASNCVAMPFDHLANPELRIVQGWLPRIELDEETHAALLRDCEAHAQCVFTFEGRLDRFALDVENPTQLAFSDVEIVAVRGATAEESWIRRPRPVGAFSSDPKVVPPRTPQREEQG